LYHGVPQAFPFTETVRESPWLQPWDESMEYLRSKKRREGAFLLPPVEVGESCAKYVEYREQASKGMFKAGKS
jgi:hypothetical protein